MTDQYGQTSAGEQPAYFQPAPQQWAPVAPIPRRPPLTPRARRGSLIGGAVGLTIVTWGIGLLAAGGIIGIITLIFTAIASTVRANGGADAGFERFLDAIPVGLIVGLVVGAIVLGIVLVLVGWLTQRAILRTHDVHRPTAVTWSSLGISVVANSIVGAVVSIPGRLLTTFSQDGGSTLVIAIIVAVVSLAATAAVGAFASWWMAHAFRAPAPGAAPGAPAAPGTPAVPAPPIG